MKLKFETNGYVKTIRMPEWVVIGLCAVAAAALLLF